MDLSASVGQVGHMNSDSIVVSDRLVGLMLYPILGWSALLLVFYVFGQIGWGLIACFPLALWLGGLTTWWGVRARARWRAGELKRHDVAAGIRTVGHILAGASSTPALVFLSNDPFAASAWSTSAGVGVVSALAYGCVSAVARWPRRGAMALALAAAWFALPLNATGAVTVASMLGWYDTVAERTLIPERSPRSR